MRHLWFWVTVGIVAILAVILFKWLAKLSGNTGLQALAQTA